MIILSNMKRLKEDIDEALSELLNSDVKGLYKHWVERYAEPHITKWLEEHDYNVETCKTFDYVKYITDRFIEWISNDK